MIQLRPRGVTPGLIHRTRRTEPARTHVDDLTIAAAHTTARFGESRILAPCTEPCLSRNSKPWRRCAVELPPGARALPCWRASGAGAVTRCAADWKAGATTAN